MSLKAELGDEETAQWLRARAVLPEDVDSVPAATWCLITISDSTSQRIQDL